MLALPVSAAFAQSFGGGGGNPVATLPQVNAPAPPPKVTVAVQQPNPQLQQLLATPVTPSAFQIQGIKSIPFAEVADRFKALVGHPTTVGQLIETANGITRMYQDAGYALSFCFVPAQSFENGVVKITAVEGYVGSVTISGDARNVEDKIRAIAAHIVADRPLKKSTFERYINVMSLLPGTQITANVAPPTMTDGATTLDLAVTRKRFTAGTGLNFNQPGIAGLLSASENGLLSLGEQLSVSALYPPGRDHQTYYTLGYSQPIGSDGLVARLDASHYDGQPDTPGLPSILKRTVKQDKVGGTVSYPILLSNTRSVVAGVSAYGSYNEDRYQNVDTGAEIRLRSQVRVLQAQIAYADTKPTQTQQATFNIGHGFNLLGASTDYQSPGNTPNPAPVDLNFTRFTGAFSQANSWPYQFGTAFNFAAQYSANTLPTPEQTTFGGQRFGLGYEPGEAGGDSGWGASFEINRSFAINYTYLTTLIPYVSYDMARVYLHRGTPVPAHLASVALGVRLTDKRFYTLDLSLGRAVGDAPAENSSRSPRVNAAFSYQLN
ncbi:MAG: ShlB/FhaC/HecB family hemolysin secretion/activation protein [Janthinobacterium lividum]